MSRLILTFACAPDRACLSADCMAGFLNEVAFYPSQTGVPETDIPENTGAETSNLPQVKWLVANIACETDITQYCAAKSTLTPSISAHTQAKQLLEEARRYFCARQMPVDCLLTCITDNENRKRRLLIADMDSTIINQECIDELGDMFGLKEKISQITIRAMRGEIDFCNALAQRVALLKGLPLETISQVLEARITLSPGARTLVQTMRANGAFTVLVSGGFTHFAKEVARRAGFHVFHANSLEVHNAHLTGRVLPPVIDSNAKAEILARICAGRGIGLSEVLAIGDGANDLQMLQRAGLAVAYHAKPVLAAQAHAHIKYGDLNTALYLQGYSKKL